MLCPDASHEGARLVHTRAMLPIMGDWDRKMAFFEALKPCRVLDDLPAEFLAFIIQARKETTGYTMMTQPDISIDQTELARVVDRCLSILPRDLNFQDADEGYESVPLCAIDSIYSIGVRYEGVKNVIARYIGYWERKGVDANSAMHTTRDFLDEFEAWDDLGGTLFGNRQRTSPRGGIPKADAVMGWLTVLDRYGIQTTNQLRNQLHNNALEFALRGVRGQGSGISAKYLFLLAGVQEAVKPDRMIIRFVSCAIGREVTPIEAEGFVVGASHQLQSMIPAMTSRRLDHLIWLAQREL